MYAGVHGVIDPNQQHPATQAGQLANRCQRFANRLRVDSRINAHPGEGQQRMQRAQRLGMAANGLRQRAHGDIGGHFGRKELSHTVYVTPGTVGNGIALRPFLWD